MVKITKHLIAGALLAVAGSTAHAQGLESVIVEKYYISNAADAAGSVGTLPVGSITYRVYVDMMPGYKFEALYGVPGHTMTINTTTSFFNNEDRGATTPTYTKAQAAGNTVMLDSWFSVGAACNGQLGVMKSEDDGTGTVVNADGILQNSDVTTGIPVATQDGMMPGTANAVTFVGLNTELDVFDATSQEGNSFSTSNGSVASLSGTVGPTATNRVLVGQFTTEGDFSFKLNVQIGTVSGGTTENYVAESPSGSEMSIPSLIYNSALETKVPEHNAGVTSLSVYPNPATDVVKLDVTTANNKTTTNNSYKVVNVLGDVVMSKSLGEISGTYSETIDMSSLPTGVYFVQMIIDGKNTTKKIVKK